MKKPEPIVRKFIPYHEIREWIKHKHGKDIDDYAGRYTSGEKDREYLCFWNYVVNTSNDSDFESPSIWLAADGVGVELEPWEVEVIDLIREEFGEYVDGDVLYID